MRWSATGEGKKAVGVGVLDMADIVALSDRIARRFDPERIVLFGSYADGRATSDSDVDLLVVMAHGGTAARKAAEILTVVRPTFGVDVVVRTPSEVRERVEQEDFFLRDVLAKGRVLYEVPDP